MCQKSIYITNYQLFIACVRSFISFKFYVFVAVQPDRQLALFFFLHLFCVKIATLHSSSVESTCEKLMLYIFEWVQSNSNASSYKRFFTRFPVFTCKLHLSVKVIQPSSVSGEVFAFYVLVITAFAK